jgi:hypothetical protein
MPIVNCNPSNNNGKTIAQITIVFLLLILLTKGSKKPKGMVNTTFKKAFIGACVILLNGMKLIREMIE